MRVEQATIGEFVEALGARTPAPASGAAAAVSGALAAGLAELAARFADDEVAVASARRLRARLLELADEDSAAYAEFMESKSDSARSRTVDVPLEIAECAAAAAALAAGLIERLSVAVAGDAEAAVALARGAAQVAGRLVELNLSGDLDDPRAARARAATASA